VDVNALEGGLISITPIGHDLTCTEEIGRLQALLKARL
jgi:hypothetical protein